eukprot:CAMPEP_0170899428 /NCGR_PEP_ID=MMETSP0734-20130129/46656_1 /TAXON_ID=186038 /ORGANISM="Fragilariopsis kerguelensis, Strain L26-C5" /LENGTH=40 /DNA_ID= /DNA_START= /DNA_END= /DNA_ORIENTATION=
MHPFHQLLRIMDVIRSTTFIRYGTYYDKPTQQASWDVAVC